MKRCDSPPALRRILTTRYHRQLRRREFPNAFERFLDRITVACRHSNLLKPCEKLCEVTVACLCGVEKRLRKPMPLVECWHQLAVTELAANPLINRSQVTQKLPKPFLRDAALCASVACCQTLKLLLYLPIKPLSVGHRIPKTLRRLRRPTRRRKLTRRKRLRIFTRLRRATRRETGHLQVKLARLAS